MSEKLIWLIGAASVWAHRDRNDGTTFVQDTQTARIVQLSEEAFAWHVRTETRNDDLEIVSATESYAVMSSLYSAMGAAEDAADDHMQRLEDER